jgi:hypothetical protein
MKQCWMKYVHIKTIQKNPPFEYAKDVYCFTCLHNSIITFKNSLHVGELRLNALWYTKCSVWLTRPARNKGFSVFQTYFAPTGCIQSVSENSNENINRSWLRHLSTNRWWPSWISLDYNCDLVEAMLRPGIEITTNRADGTSYRVEPRTVFKNKRNVGTVSIV